MIKVSFVLTTYNSIDNFTSTIDSILSQDYKNIEIIVKDGQSTDGTLEQIESYALKYPNIIKYQTSSDRGIYDAMNQGLKLCTGDVIIVFNDKFVCKDAVSRAIQELEKNKECVGVHSDLIYTIDGKPVRQWIMKTGTFDEGWMPAHPTLFLRKEIYERNDWYDTNYKCAGDYEFIIRVLKNMESKLVYISTVLVEMFYGGQSTSGIKAYLLSLVESYRALKKNGYKHPLLILIKRIIIVMGQFRKKDM